MTVAYLVNQYPKVSHSFIRREIAALEHSGLPVQRYALRGWDADLPDPDDRAEQGRTHYLLRHPAALAGPVLRRLAGDPAAWWRTARLAWRCAWRSDRPPPLWLAYFAEACALAEDLAARGIDHLHAHFGTNSATVAMLAHELGGCSYSFTVHGPEEFDKPEFLHLGEKVRRAAFVVAISSYGRSQLYRWTPQAQWDKVQVVHCGLEAAFHAGAVQPVPDVPQLLCVGRLCEQKGQLLLLEAAAALRRQGRSFRLVLAGDGELRPAIEALVRAHDLSRHVQVTGWVGSSTVRELMLASRALVLPSFAEGLPVVLMEALALARPVVTTAIAGIPELVVDGRNGWLVPAGCVGSLTRALAEVLDTGVDRLDAMGRAGREAVLAQHDIGRESARLRALFDRQPGRRTVAATVPIDA